ncbi:MAG: hypothetical protein ACPG4N_13645, partial [Gammaproteobacteria bacterium]
MKVVKQTDEYTILARRDGRHAVKSADRQFIHGEEKTKILLAEGLIKQSEAKLWSAARVGQEC